MTDRYNIWMDRKVGEVVIIPIVVKGSVHLEGERAWQFISEEGQIGYDYGRQLDALAHRYFLEASK